MKNNKSNYKTDNLLNCLEDRLNIEEFIKTAFQKKYNAKISFFYPNFIVVYKNQTLVGVLGWQKGNNNKFFLECYLEHNIENVIKTKIGIDLKRDEIIEIGNLATIDSYASFCLFAHVFNNLNTLSSKFIVFTATRSLLSILIKMKITTYILSEAKSSCLNKEDITNWGSYYEHKPIVIASPLLKC